MYPAPRWKDRMWPVKTCAQSQSVELQKQPRPKDSGQTHKTAQGATRGAHSPGALTQVDATLEQGCRDLLGEGGVLPGADPESLLSCTGAWVSHCGPGRPDGSWVCGCVCGCVCVCVCVCGASCGDPCTSADAFLLSMLSSCLMNLFHPVP